MARTKKLPALRDRAAVARFFITHDSADYVDPIPEPIEIDPALERRIRAKQKKRQVTLRLNEWMIAAAKDISEKTGVPYQVLLKLWIAEGIHGSVRFFHSERRKGPRARAS